MGKKIFLPMIYSNIYLALGSCSLSYSACMIIGIEYNITIFLIIFSFIFIVYNLDRLKDDPSDISNIPGRTLFIIKNKKILIFLVSVNVIFLIYCILITSIKVFLLLLLIYLPGIAYSLPILPFFLTRNDNYKRIKDIPLAKAFIVAFDWTVVVVVIPMAINNAAYNIEAIFMCIYIFIFCLSNVAIFDMRDIKGDFESNIVTIPIFFGIKKTKKIIYNLNFLIFVLLLILIRLNLIDESAKLIFASIIYTVLYVIFFKTSRHEEYCSILVDGNPLFTGLIALIF